MKKTLASVVMIAFAGLLCASFFAVFDGSALGSRYLDEQMHQHSYFIAY